MDYQTARTSEPVDTTTSLWDVFYDGQSTDCLSKKRALEDCVELSN